MGRGESLEFVCSEDICWWKCVENGGNLENFVACGGRKGNKEKGKRKRNS